ncbi:MAG TPA: DUF6600 domain-containing protein [Rhizomicrobium sp.]
MGRPLSSAVYAAALLLSGASLVALAPPAQAAVGIRLGFNYFHDRMAPYGRWLHHPLWGDVWRPRRSLAGPGFQPYTNGHWELTDEYGWYWVSDDAFDDVVYHYGRWVYDPQWEWLWVPGYTWAPAWVSWREGEDYTGWMPLPPDQAFLSGGGLSFGVNLGAVGFDFYRRWYGPRVDADRFYVFVDNRHLVERDYRRFRVPRERVVTIISRTRPVTRFEVVNNRVVNRGVDVKVIERAAGRRIAPVSAKVVIKPNAVITTVNEAKEIRQRERVQHPIEAERRGAGAAPGNDKGNAAETGPGPGGNGAEQGSPATGETGKNKGNRKGASETPETDNNANGAEQGNPATGETGKKKAGRKGAGETPETGNSMMGPNAPAGATNEGNETPGGAAPKRHKNSGSMTGPGNDEAGAGGGAGGSTGANESATPPRHQRNNGNAGNMGGMNTMSSPNGGPGKAQTGAMSGSNGANASSSSMSSGQNAPANGEQPKKKKKPKDTTEDQSTTPQQ